MSMSEEKSERNLEMYNKDGYNYSQTNKTLLNERIMRPLVVNTHSENSLHKVWTSL